MRVTFHGVRGSVPTPGPSTVRYGGNTVCVEARLADNTLLVLDAGTGIRDLGRELILVGEGPLENALRRRAAALGIAGRVRFAGFLDRMGVRSELRDAACFVNPADYETGPLTVLEAMACGTPVVTTHTGLAVEMGARPPLYLARSDSQALANALIAVLRDPDLAALRAREARTLVATRFDWDHTVDRLEAIYGLRREQAA